MRRAKALGNELPEKMRLQALSEHRERFSKREDGKAFQRNGPLYEKERLAKECLTR